MSAELSWLQQTQFYTSAPTLALCPPDDGLEIAFAGRSNAGKSSAINALTQQKQLARASKKPGRTQMINFFHMKGDTSRRMVDLPGYGYAAVPEAMKLKWQEELGNYLVERQSLMALILLMDIRHPLQYFDEQMLHWAKDGELDVHILLTKADKFKRNKANMQLFAVQKQLKENDLDCSVQLFSAHKGIGLQQTSEVIARYLDYPPVSA